MNNLIKKMESGLTPLINSLKGAVASVREKFGKEGPVIGVDAGFSSVKVVEMGFVNGGMSIVKTNFVQVRGVPGKREELQEALKLALVGVNTDKAKIIAVINCPQTCTRKVITPKMPKKELDQAIRWEAKNAIPFSIEDALMDYEVLGETVENGVKKSVVAVAASPKETVNGLVQLFADMDLTLTAAVPISLCLQNLIRKDKEFKDMNLAVCELGASITELDIYQKGNLAFSRKLPITGRDLTKAMTSTLMAAEGKVELGLEEAETIKRAHGIPDGEGDEMIDGKIRPSQVLSLVRPCIEQLASEIERSFDFFREESHGEKVGKIVLYGGGANLKGLTDYLHKELGVPVVVGNAFAHLEGARPDATEENEPSRFDLALGAALELTGKINLLPVEVKEKTRRFIEHVSLQAVAVAVVVSIILVFMGLNIQVAAFQKKLKALRLEERTLLPQRETAQMLMVADRIQGAHPHWEDVLREISNVIQPKMYLTGLNMEKDMVNITGVVTQGDQDAQSILSNFMITLENGIFSRVSLVSSRRQTQGEMLFEFEIVAEVE